MLRAVLACLALAGLWGTPAAAQTLTNDLFNPAPGGFLQPDESFLRKTKPQPGDDAGQTAQAQAQSQAPAPSRIGNIPTYGIAAAAGAGDTGYDSLGRKKKQPPPYPGAHKPKPPPGPGTPAPPDPLPTRPVPPSSTANKPPLAPALAGNVPGQPKRKRLKPDNDPFGAVGDYVGSFLVKSAVEIRGGYDTNPGRFSSQPKGSAFYVVAPELVATSDWSRHSLVVDLRGSFTGYGSTFPAQIDGAASPVPTNVDRVDFTGKVDGRIDVSRDTRILGELRMKVGADNPGSPNVEAGLSKYPLYTTIGGSTGVEQDFNRLRLTFTGNVDRTTYQDSQLTDGTISSNADRDYNQYGGVARASYEVLPWLKPFGEVEGDTRVHDLKFDTNRYQRDSSGGYAKVGTTFELTHLITGEVAVGYVMRDYADPRLNKLEGLLTSASLVWAPTGLTTVKFNADTQAGESTLPGVSGVLARTYTVEVDHDFRRWLTGIGKFTYGTYDYEGSTRLDKSYSLVGDLVWKLTRSFQVKAELRRDWLESNVAGASSASNVVMLGVRVQN